MEKTNFKTPTYQRKAYRAYLDRNKDNEEFKEKRREQQRQYYRDNRDKILERIKNKKISQMSE
jgi:hypothetical protein